MAAISDCETAANILTMGGTDLVSLTSSLTSPVTPIHSDTVLIVLGSNGVNMRGNQRVNCVQGVFVNVLHCKHTALDGCAVHSHPKQCA
ncbi:unnamed protein product [Staurois parvus]|uniref:Uncharacterized protein n=1 Tax=Staurois parvus TaxID=386267 RepID=A0ABN9GMJ9_9NEOB|nr:unnamed protein product [Staurois parvus]